MSEFHHYSEPDDSGEYVLSEADPRKRVLGSWGISAIVHMGVLIVLGLLTIAIEMPQEDVIIVATIQRPKKPVKPLVNPDVAERELIPEEDLIVDPIVKLDPEVEITQTPEGVSPDLQTDKNLNANFLLDAAGVGGGPAGQRGNPWGKGNSDIGFQPETVEMADAALRWLARHQVQAGADKGRWGANDWNRQCDGKGCSGHSYAEPGNVGPGRGLAAYDVGVSALALLAFLGRGNTARVGDFKKNVRNGLRWLQKQQDPVTGAIGFDPHHSESIYNHAIATMALCEAYFYGDDFRLEEPAQKAVDFCLKAQNPDNGWRYGVRSGQNDTSVTGWMVLALKAAHTAGLDVPKGAHLGARNWFDRATASDGAVGYNRPGGGSSLMPSLRDKLGPKMYQPVPCMTAVAVVCRIFTGQDPKERVIRDGAALLMEELPEWDADDLRKANFYYWYYGSYAMFQVGGKDWLRWNDAMLTALKASQRRAGGTHPDTEGSWDPSGEWGFVGGRVYATAINALTLQIYYRYERMTEGRE